MALPHSRRIQPDARMQPPEDSRLFMLRMRSPLLCLIPAWQIPLDRSVAALVVARPNILTSVGEHAR